jgi:hypothetical protein
MFTRLGYIVIVAIMVVAGAAIAFVVWPSGSSDTPDAATPTATSTADTRPSITFERVIDFTRLGAVLTIEAQGQDVTVTFREDFDTSGFNTGSHVFRSSLEPRQDVVQVLEAAGIAVNGPGGVAVSTR